MQPQQQQEQQQQQQQWQQKLTPAEFWVLKLSQCASYVSTTLNIRKLAEMIQGAASLSGNPVWLLGTCHEMQGPDASTTQVVESMRQDFSSRIWCTYRRGFPALGEGGFTSDVGWGCTLRSGQMLVAEALSRQLLGRSWRRSLDGSLPPDMLSVLALLQDYSAETAPLSIHSICAAGKEHGVLPGRWLGPWTLCKSLEATLRSSRPAGLQVYVVCDPGGGAPTLDVSRIRQQIFGQQPGSQDPAASAQLDLHHHSGNGEHHGNDEQQQQQQQQQGDEVEHDGGQQQDSQQGEGAGVSDSCANVPEEQPQHDACAQAAAARDSCVEGSGQAPAGTSAGSDALEPGTASSSHESLREKDESSVQPDQRQGSFAGQHEEQCKPPVPGPLLLLIPLTLGMGKMNPLYFPQLKQALTFPQSVGIVGGRPSSSLFFIGHHNDNLLYLDPHETQAAAPLPATSPSYFCGTVRLMPMTSMDPSLAIGFLCPTLDDFADLCTRLQQLCTEFSSAPLLTVALNSSASGCLDHYQTLEDEIYNRVEALGSSGSDGEAEACFSGEVLQEETSTPAESQPDPQPLASADELVSQGESLKLSGKRDEWEVL